MGFSNIFWGFLFLIDFRINGFDLLPDIVGYLLIFYGLGKMLSESNHFQSARNIALPLALVSILDIIQINTPISSETSFFAVLLSIVLGIMNLMMVYHICHGIIDMAMKYNNTYIQRIAGQRWRIYAFVTLSIIFFTFLIFISNDLAAILVIPVLLASLISYVLIMDLIKKAENAFQRRG